MGQTTLLLGVDGGGTGCRARLTDLDLNVLGEGTAGPANIRIGLKESIAAVMRAAEASFDAADLVPGDDVNVIACLALAGASEPSCLAAARTCNFPFTQTVLTTDAHAACIGAHGGKSGGIIIIGTGSIGWGFAAGQDYRVGGWGYPISDEGSGAWLGGEAVRRTLWAYDGRAPWSDLLKQVLGRFDGDPHAVVRWTAQAQPRDYATFAPFVIEHAKRNDPVAHEILRAAGQHIDAIAARLNALGVPRLALSGGLAPLMKPWLSAQTRALLVEPQGDALSGALQLARDAALSAHAGYHFAAVERSA